MTKFYLGVDIGSSTSHALLVDEEGQVLTFIGAGPGNHEVVGYEGLHDVLHHVTNTALQSAGIGLDEIQGAGFGVSGYDWPSEHDPTMKAIESLGLTAPLGLVNDTLLGLMAGTEKGWGIAVLAGSGGNCWGRDPGGKIGRMTGLGLRMGEFGGASSIASKAIQAISAEWSQRGPATSLTNVFLETTGAEDLDDLIEGLSLDRYHIGGEIAPVIFQLAEAGDTVAEQIVEWAAEHLTSLVVGVVHQLNFQNKTFEVIEMGGVFQAGKVLTEPFHAAVLQVAPRACFVPLKVPPVLGAVLLAVDKAGVDQSQIRKQIKAQWEQL